jgi:putative membrane protein
MTIIITRILFTALTLLVLAEFAPGIEIEGVYIAIISSIILGLINVTVRPILVFLTLPITILTLGLFIYIINTLTFWFASSFIDGFNVDGFWWALIGSATVSISSYLANRYLIKKN